MWVGGFREKLKSSERDLLIIRFKILCGTHEPDSTFKSRICRRVKDLKWIIRWLVISTRRMARCILLRGNHFLKQHVNPEFVCGGVF